MFAEVQDVGRWCAGTRRQLVAVYSLHPHDQRLLTVDAAGWRGRHQWTSFQLPHPTHGTSYCNLLISAQWMILWH